MSDVRTAPLIEGGVVVDAERNLRARLAEALRVSATDERKQLLTNIVHTLLPTVDSTTSADELYVVGYAAFVCPLEKSEKAQRRRFLEIARHAFVRAINISPDPFTQLLLAEVLYDQRKFGEALMALEKIGGGHFEDPNDNLRVAELRTCVAIRQHGFCNSQAAVKTFIERCNEASIQDIYPFRMLSLMQEVESSGCLDLLAALNAATHGWFDGVLRD